MTGIRLANVKLMRPRIAPGPFLFLAEALLGLGHLADGVSDSRQ